MNNISNHVLGLIRKAKSRQDKELDLSDLGLMQFPEEIYELDCLEVLNLSENRIKNIPTRISELKQLKQLNLVDNPLKEIINTYGLVLDYKIYQVFKKQISQENIVGLHFSNNEIESLPQLSEFKNLTYLGVQKTQLKEVPEFIGQLINLTELYFFNAKIECIPEFIGQLKGLTRLSFWGNKIEKIPEFIGQLTNLTYLSFGTNPIEKIPEFVGQLKNLTALYLYQNNLTAVPEFIGQLKDLSKLYLWGNKIEEIPEFIGQLKNLTELDLGSNQLMAVPEFIGQLQNLTKLNLYQNNLTAVPEFIGQLQYLTYLSIGSNPIEKIPEFIGKMKYLTELYLQQNKLKEVPEFVGQLKDLSKLYLWGNEIEEIPEFIGQLQNLTELNLSSNQLTAIPESIGQLRNLTKLNLSSNKLTAVPEFIGQLQNLSELNLSSNQLTAIPESIGQLKDLVELNLYSNKFTTIPDCIGQLKNLTKLYLWCNKIEKIPESIGKLQNLTGLDLDSNQIIVIPKFIGQMKNLKILKTSKNPLKIPPVEVTQKGILAIREYFKELAEQGAEFIYEAKLVLIGEPGAGKTSLAEKLLNYNYELNHDEPMTKGIDVKKWSFPYKYDRDIKFTANIWDFGGQHIMHSTHKYFLTRRSLYILLADNRKEDTDFYYWLSMVDLFSSKCPILIVLNEKHKYKKYVPEAVLKTFECIKNVCYINLADNTGLSDLSNAVQKAMIDLPHVGKEPIPQKWVRIREQLENDDRDYISKLEYLEICQKYGVGDELQALRISEFLHDLGAILHFQKDTLLKNTVILNIHWATEAVYLILFDQDVINNAGEFDNSTLERIWAEPKYKNKHADLLQLMIKFELCYEIGKSQKYIIPELLPENPTRDFYPKEFEAAKGGNLLHFEYRYTFMPKGIISRLIVRMNQHIYKKLQWKFGVVLELENAKVEIVENFFQKNLKMRITGKNRLEALAVVRTVMKELHDTFENLKYYEMIPCNCPDCKENDAPHFYTYELLQKYKQKGVFEIICEKDLKNTNVLSLINDVIIPSKERPVTDDNLDTETPKERKQLIPKERKKVFISYSHKDKEWLERVQVHFKVLENEGVTIDLWDDTKIKAGMYWKQEIENALSEAKIALLMVSTDFLASDFIAKNELPPLLKAARDDGAKIIPLIVKPSRFTRNKDIAQFQAINEPTKPLNALKEAEQEAILVELTNTVEDYLKK